MYPVGILHHCIYHRSSIGPIVICEEAVWCHLFCHTANHNTDHSKCTLGTNTHILILGLSSVPVPLALTLSLSPSNSFSYLWICVWMCQRKSRPKPGRRRCKGQTREELMPEVHRPYLEEKGMLTIYGIFNWTKEALTNSFDCLLVYPTNISPPTQL